MYFPYLRGKQFELIALREIFQFLNHTNLVSPIIEPVKETTVTLEKTITSLINNNQNFNLVFNPHVGDVGTSKGSDEIIRIKDSLLSEYSNYQPTLIINEKSKINVLSDFIGNNHLLNLSIICNGVPIMEEEFFTFIETQQIRYLIINDSINSKRFIREIRKRDIDMISLSDPFKILPRNVDYENNIDEFFSDEHLFFREEGFVGFSDFLTIGKEYSDTGFLPYAVAIHLTYSNSKNEFWVHHFVSDSNLDTNDVTGKFEEALSKLIDFINSRRITSVASNEFREIYKNQSYPGLGTIKKLSIKHHIELANTTLISLQ